MVLTVLGAVVLVVAVYALNQHTKGKGANPAAARRSSTGHTVTEAPPSSGSGASSMSSSTSATRTPTKQPSASASGSSETADPAAAKDVPLVVLNNTTIPGLAGRAADRFTGAGWTVTQTGNLQNDILSTCAYYDPSEHGAKHAAKVLQNQFPTIKRVETRFAELPAAPVVVVLTPDYSEG